VRSSAGSIAGLSAALVAPSVLNEERRRDVQSIARSIAGSVALSIANEERRRDVQSIARSITGSVASLVANEERRRDVRSIANHMRLSAYACKGRFRSCRKAETQYEKIFYVPQPPLTACKVVLAVCRRKKNSIIDCLG
jgi:hypothetical protein